LLEWSDTPFRGFASGASDPSFLAEKHEIAICERKHLFEVFEPLTTEQEEALPRVWHRPPQDEVHVPARVYRHAFVLHFLNGNREMAIRRTTDWLERIGQNELRERQQAENQMMQLNRTH
jgi:hypothetical protein